MAEYSGVGAGFRIVILILLVGVLALGGLVWFDYLGILDARRVLAPVFSWFGAKKPAVEAEDPLLLEKERLAKQIEALAVRAEELSSREQQITSREQELTQKVEQVEEREKAAEEREKVFNDRIQAFENRRVNLKQNATYLVDMPPDKAVKILLDMEDQDVIDLFRIAEQQAAEAGELSMVSYWLSLMPPDRAAALERKMMRRTGG